MYVQSGEKSNGPAFRLFPIPGTLHSQSKVLHNILDRLSELENQIQSIKTARIDRLAIKSRNNYELIDVEDIVRCEASGSYTHIHLSDQRIHTVPRTLKQIQSELPKDLFIRVHQSHLINLAFVRFLSLDACSLTLIDRKVIPFSRKNKETVKSLILNR